MNALRRISDLSKPLKDERRQKAEESPHELARQSEAKRKQAPQSEENVSTTTTNENEISKKTSLINCTGHPIMHRAPNKK